MDNNVSKIKVSVLIPIYGVEKYIEKCARSLFNQTMKDGIEFIFTNDCTKDNSIAILKRVIEEYPERRGQITIINHPENLGIAEARVTGFNHARGEYVIHCDSDDWVVPEMYEELYREAERTHADIVGCDWWLCTNKIEHIKDDFTLPQSKLMTELIKSGGTIKGYLWNRLIRREFYIEHNLRAAKGVTLLDDMAIVIPAHALTNRVAYVPKALYYYRRTDVGSMSAGLSERNILSAIKVLLQLSQIPYLQSWKSVLIRRLKGFLFARLYTRQEERVLLWKSFEFKLINELEIPLSLKEKVRVWFIQHNFYRTQYHYHLIGSMATLSFWKYQILSKFLRKNRILR